MSSKKRFAYKLSLYFAKALPLETPVKGMMEISSAWDSWTLSPECLVVEYERSRRQPADKVLNPKRLKRIRELLMACATATGSIPEIDKIVYCSEDAQTEEPCPSALKSTIDCVIDSFLEPHQISSLFSYGESTGKETGKNSGDKSSNEKRGMSKPIASRKDLFSALSYLIASGSASDQADRFRLLWSGFNALYRSSKEKSEYKKAAAYLGSGFAKARVDFQQGLAQIDIDAACWSWNKFLSSFSALKPPSKDKPFSNNCTYVLEYADEEILTVFENRESNSSRKTKEARRDSFRERKNKALQSEEEGAGKKGDRFIFIVCFYMYWRRCDSMHGESQYPLFSSDTEKSKLEEGLCIVLESVVKEGIRLTLERQP